MIYLLYGSDTYRSRIKLRGIAAEFERRSGGTLNVTRVDVTEQPEVVFEAGRTRSLFAEKELVVMERVSESRGDVQAYIKERLAGWAESKIFTVIFWEGDVRTGDGLVKAMVKAATKAQEFKELPLPAVRRWIAAEAAAKRARLAPREADLLAERFGPNLWAISNELEKIRDGWSVEKAGGEEEKVWDFTDAFFKNRRSAFRPLSQLLEAGQEAIYMLGALASSLETLTLIWWGAKTGRMKQAGAGVHPYVVKKNLGLAERLTSDALRHYYDDVAAADVEQKTGKLPPPLPLVKLVLGKVKSKTVPL